MHHVTPVRTGAPAPPPDARSLEGLTPEQRAAVEHGTGPLMVFAGPGAGKTRTITHRIAHLLGSGRVQPSEILAVTFTVAAAAQMRERIAALLGGDRRARTAPSRRSTACARGSCAATPASTTAADYTVYDEADVTAVIKHVLRRASRG